MNQFGTNFRISIFGESHGTVIGVVLDGVPSGMPLSEEDFAGDLARRRSGAPGTTPRREADQPKIVSGLYEGHTTGAPLAILFANENTRSEDYSHLASHPRPSHADWTAALKYGGFNDPRGGGHFSGRLTLTLVAAGVLAKKMLGDTISFETRVAEIGGCAEPERFELLVKEASAAGDSLGGIIECVASGVPAGLGEPFFESLESVTSHLLFSIPGIKGVEFGNGFEAAKLRGSQNNDPIIDSQGRTATNNSGGINGGITNGNPIVVRVSVKPTSSIGVVQKTYNMGSGTIEPLEIGGRHDACIALRAAVVVEAAIAISIAQFIQTKP